MLESIWMRTAQAIEENTQQGWRGRFDLAKQFAVFDMESSGFVSMDTFQSTLEDIGVALSPAELNAITISFGHPEADAVDYEDFCGGMDRYISQMESSSGAAAGSGGGAASWITQRVVDRLRALRRDGQNPRDLFDVIDVDRCGLVGPNDVACCCLLYVIIRIS